MRALMTSFRRCSRLSRSRKLLRVAPLTVVVGSNYLWVLSHRQDLLELFTNTFTSWRIEDTFRYESVWCIIMRFIHHLYKRVVSRLVVISCTCMRDAKLYWSWYHQILWNMDGTRTSLVVSINIGLLCPPFLLLPPPPGATIESVSSTTAKSFLKRTNLGNVNTPFLLSRHFFA